MRRAPRTRSMADERGHARTISLAPSMVSTARKRALPLCMRSNAVGDALERIGLDARADAGLGREGEGVLGILGGAARPALDGAARADERERRDAAAARGRQPRARAARPGSRPSITAVTASAFGAVASTTAAPPSACEGCGGILRPPCRCTRWRRARAPGRACRRRARGRPCESPSGSRTAPRDVRARRALHGDQIAGFGGAVAEGVEGGDAGAEERCGLRVAERVGNARQGLGGHDQVVGVAAVVGDAADAPFAADDEVAAAGTGRRRSNGRRAIRRRRVHLHATREPARRGRDDAGDLVARDARQLQARERRRPARNVAVADAAGVDAHEHFARTRSRHRALPSTNGPFAAAICAKRDTAMCLATVGRRVESAHGAAPSPPRGGRLRDTRSFGIQRPRHDRGSRRSTARPPHPASRRSMGRGPCTRRPSCPRPPRRRRRPASPRSRPSWRAPSPWRQPRAERRSGKGLPRATSVALKSRSAEARQQAARAERDPHALVAAARGDAGRHARLRRGRRVTYGVAATPRRNSAKSRACHSSLNQAGSGAPRRSAMMASAAALERPTNVAHRLLFAHRDPDARQHASAARARRSARCRRGRRRSRR